MSSDMKVEKETWWSEEIQDCIQRKRSTKGESDFYKLGRQRDRW